MDEPSDVEIAIRLTPEQFRLLREMAEQRGLSPGVMAQLLLASELNREFLRDARLHALKREVLEEQQELIRERRLEAVKSLSEMNLPVSDWEEMEREIESMWEEPLYDDSGEDGE